MSLQVVGSCESACADYNVHLWPAEVENANILPIIRLAIGIYSADVTLTYLTLT